MWSCNLLCLQHHQSGPCRSVFKDPAYDNATHMNGVPDTYLPVRDGCRLTLYNDAHQVMPLPCHILICDHLIMVISKMERNLPGG